MKGNNAKKMKLNMLKNGKILKREKKNNLL